MLHCDDYYCVTCYFLQPAPRPKKTVIPNDDSEEEVVVTKAKAKVYNLCLSMSSYIYSTNK